MVIQNSPSVLWRCWLGGSKGIQSVKNWVVGCWRGCLGWGADLHIAQQMPLPFTISYCSKSFLVLPFWYLLTWVVPDIFQNSSKTVVWKRLCVCHSENVLHISIQQFSVKNLTSSLCSSTPISYQVPDFWWLVHIKAVLYIFHCACSLLTPPYFYFW